MQSNFCKSCVKKNLEEEMCALENSYKVTFSSFSGIYVSVHEYLFMICNI